MGGTVMGEFADWVVDTEALEVEVMVAVEMTVVVEVMVGRFVDVFCVDVWAWRLLCCRTSSKRLADSFASTGRRVSRWDVQVQDFAG